MEPNALSFFGLDIETLAMMAGFVYVIVEALKKKFAAVFMGGWKTDLVALLISAGLAYKVYYPDLWAFIPAVVICWLGPAIFNNKTNGNK